MRQPGFLQTSNPDIIEMKRGGGYQAALGLPFLFAGLFILQVPSGFIPVASDETPLMLAIMMPLGLVFAIAGAALLVLRNGIVIDRGHRIITQWWGLILPMRKKEYCLDAFRSVRLDCVSGDDCMVTLVGHGKPGSLYIPSPGDYEVARRLAEQLSFFLGKPLEDLPGEKTDDENGLQ